MKKIIINLVLTLISVNCLAQGKVKNSIPSTAAKVQKTIKHDEAYRIGVGETRQSAMYFYQAAGLDEQFRKLRTSDTRFKDVTEEGYYFTNDASQGKHQIESLCHEIGKQNINQLEKLSLRSQMRNGTEVLDRTYSPVGCFSKCEYSDLVQSYQCSAYMLYNLVSSHSSQFERPAQCRPDLYQGFCTERGLQQHYQN